MVLVKRRQVEVTHEVLAKYLRALGEIEGRFSPATLFGNDRPVEIEVGFGKGLFLLTAATASPEINYLGLEVSHKCAVLTAKRLAAAGIENVRLLLGDARYVFTRHLPDSSIQAVHTYFPDPWWKRRHQKRRLYTAAFVRQVERVLRPDGQLHLWTDVEAYFQTIQEILQQHTGLEPLDLPEERVPSHEMDYRTHFETLLPAFKDSRYVRLNGKPLFLVYHPADLPDPRVFSDL